MRAKKNELYRTGDGMVQSKPRVRAIVAAFALFICALTLVATGFARHEDETKQQINKTFDEYVTGWRTSNVEILSKIYANDAKVSAYWPDPSRPALLVGWPKISKNLQDVFERLHEVSPYGMDLDFNDRIIDIYGDTAVLTSNWVWHHPADPAFGTGRGTFIFQRRGTKWVIVHEHSSVSPFDSTR
jgi:hypothetical protein